MHLTLPRPRPRPPTPPHTHTNTQLPHLPSLPHTAPAAHLPVQWPVTTRPTCREHACMQRGAVRPYRLQAAARPPARNDSCPALEHTPAAAAAVPPGALPGCCCVAGGGGGLWGVVVASSPRGRCGLLLHLHLLHLHHLHHLLNHHPLPLPHLQGAGLGCLEHRKRGPVVEGQDAGLEGWGGGGRGMVCECALREPRGGGRRWGKDASRGWGRRPQGAGPGGSRASCRHGWIHTARVCPPPRPL